MKKMTIVMMVLVLGWLSKISYDVLNFNQQQTLVLQQLHQAEKNNANLNDRLVALQRNQENAVPTKIPVAATPENQIHPIVLLQQQLDLIEFALQQQQYAYALEQLSHLELTLSQYTLADSLKQSLKHAITKDRQDIQRFVNERHIQQQQVNQLLLQFDQALAHEGQQQNLSPPVKQSAPFWQKWIQIESVDKPSVLLMQRQFILKEAQLHLLLARQLLLQGHYLIYQQEMTIVITILSQLPDQQARQFLEQIEQSKNLKILPAPHLTTRALLR